MAALQDRDVRAASLTGLNDPSRPLPTSATRRRSAGRRTTPISVFDLGRRRPREEGLGPWLPVHVVEIRDALVTISSSAAAKIEHLRP